MNLANDKLESLLGVLTRTIQEAVRLFAEIRGHPAPATVADLLFEKPPRLDPGVDPRVADLYDLLWKHRNEALARFYDPDRIYLGRSLYKLLLTLPEDDPVPPSSLLEAAKASFFLHIRSKWHRVRIEEKELQSTPLDPPGGTLHVEAVVKPKDILINNILREMRKQGLLADVEVPVIN